MTLPEEASDIRCRIEVVIPSLRQRELQKGICARTNRPAHRAFEAIGSFFAALPFRDLPLRFLAAWRRRQFHKAEHSVVEFNLRWKRYWLGRVSEAESLAVLNN